MASCARLETPPAVLSGLARLRDLSRLVLAAIERDDLDEIARLGREGERLASVIAPFCHGAGAAALPPEILDLLAEIGGMNGAIVGRLEDRRRETAAELAELRTAKNRLRAVRLHGSPDATIIDRAT